MAILLPTIAFTGHRPDKLPDKATGYQEPNPTSDRIKTWLANVIRRVYQHNNTRTYITGGALGVDTWAAEAVLAFRKEFSETYGFSPVQLVLAIPCQGQESKWPKAAQLRYQQILEQADRVEYIFNGFYDERPGCMIERDHWMVDAADGILAVYNGTNSGTGKTVQYALQKGKPVTVLSPVTWEQKRLSL